ncbi:hypothetical protein, partial [Salmonella sp. s51228]|uniref:hypothetical protein n=1 Tax=Salmonella sp. s51228 TaxID=3159652 RepID=UPI0039807948
DSIRVNGIERVDLSADIKTQIINKTNEYGTGEDTLRCLALATVDTPTPIKDMELDISTNFINYEQHMTFIGLVGIVDPPREEVKSALKECEL